LRPGADEAAPSHEKSTFSRRAGASLYAGGLLRSARNDKEIASLASRRRAGFTLVEVIVVLVILAILAAIAIPALTGYIDKAKWRDVELRFKTQLTAIQTMITEAYAENELDSRNLYPSFAWISDSESIEPDQTVLEIGLTGNQFYHDYENLTGDTYSFQSHNPSVHYAEAWVSRSGSILCYYYYDKTVFSSPSGDLLVFYLYDIDSDTSEYFFTSMNNYFTSKEEAKQAGFRSGVNVAKETYDTATYEFTLERLN
jgi:prepilin-type N-terminal cleavage/methylation domain-containing protein